VRDVAATDGRDIAWAATLRHDAARAHRGTPPLRIERDALRAHERVIRPGRLLLLAVDASGSMGGARIVLARRVAEALLHDAYLRRDRVAMLAFCGQRAELLFAPTSQAELVRRAVDGLACGGTTPLAAALWRAHELVQRDARRDAARRPTLVLLSDGRANVGARPGYAALLDELEAAAHTLRDRRGLRVVFLDATDAGRDDRPARNLAKALGVRRIVLRSLGPDPVPALRAALTAPLGR